MTFWLRFGLIAFVVLAIVIATNKIDRMVCAAKFAEMKADAEAARRLDENFLKGVDHKNSEIIAELRRISTAKITEVIRETQKVEYRCPLLPDGERLRLDTIRAANRAAGFDDAPLPANTDDAGKGPGGAAFSISGPGDDVR
jgi:hypothetical protein